jgi:hypothetical protein
MADGSNGGAQVSNIWVRCRDALSRLLDPAEREAVFGDFAGLALTDYQAVKSLLGLVVRRQLRLWKEWTPWFALVAIIMPVSPLLAKLCIELDQGIWPILWMKLHHGISYQTGLSPAARLSGFCFQGVALITWSWTSGFALATLSRKTVWVTGACFFALYLDFARDGWLFGGLSWLIGWAWLPLLTNLLFVLLPAYCGIRQSAKLLHGKLPRIVLLALWTIAMGGLAFWTQGWNQAAMDNWGRGGSALTLSQLALRSDAWKVG